MTYQKEESSGEINNLPGKIFLKSQKSDVNKLLHYCIDHAIM